MTHAKRLLWMVVAIVLVTGATALAATNLPIGKVTTGTISTAAQINKYSFSAAQGDVFDFTTDPTSGNLDVHIQLFTADSLTPFASAQNYFTSCEGGPVELNNVKLPSSSTGVYTVWISDCASTNTGNYSIYMQRTNHPAGATALTLDKTFTGTISAATAQDTYSYSGTAGEVLQFSAIPTGSGLLTPRFRLFNPDGSALATAQNYFTSCEGGDLEMNTVSLPTTGSYTLLFGDCADVNSGSYSLFVQSTNLPAGPVAGVLWGEVQDGTVNVASGLVQETTYSFQGNAGDTIDLTVVPSGSLDSRVRIYNPDGSLFTSAMNYFTSCEGGTLQMSNLAIKTTGRYVVFVDDCNHVNGANYTLSGQCAGVCQLPAPVISSISPTSVLVGRGGFTITVKGSNFVSANAQSVVQWNGIDLATTFVNTGQLTASVPATDDAVAGCAPITVFTPSSGGGSIANTSNSVQFCVNNPVPGLTSLSPASAIADGVTFALTLTGSGFVPASTVSWNGSALASTYVSATQLTATVPASNIALAGTATVAVTNATPGGGTASLTFVVDNPPPGLTSISPAEKTAGVAAFTLTANGSGFVNTSSVQWNGTALPTTYVSAAQLTASVPASDIACGTSVPITISNPAPGGGTSLAKTLIANNPLPLVSSISPTNAGAGGAQFTLTVTGSKFVTCSVIQWNGTSLRTTFVSSARLTAMVPASDLQTPGTANVTVFSPAPSGGTSSPALPFTIGSYPVPTTTSIQPASAMAGASGFTLIVKGSNFVQVSTVDWNGTALPTTFVSASELTAAVPQADIATAGTAKVTVVNPSPGGGTSTPPLTFVVNNPVPSLSSMMPTTTPAQGPAFTLTVNGSNFVPSSSVLWNGASLSTAYLSSSQVTAAVPASDIAAPGTATVTVSNPAPGGGTAAPGLTFTIGNPVAFTPVITPAAGSYGVGQMVSIKDSTTGAAIYYTTNGTAPTTASTLYSKPFLIASSLTVQAIAVASGFTQSAVASSAYIIGGSGVVLDLPAVSVTTSSGIMEAEVDDEGLAGQVWFAYGTSSTALSSTTAVQALSASTKGQKVQAALTGLSPSTTYYYQAVITTAGGIGSGAILSFTTP